MRKILFIHNPNAGSGRSQFKAEILGKQLNSSFDYQYMITGAPRHATHIVETEKNNFDSFIAIGGDGTVNEIGKVLINSNKVMGIIPTGSGNGLAIELGIKKSPVKAINLMLRGNEKTIDTLRINEEACLNVAGVGFDAEVARNFEKHKTRGFLTYVYSTLRTYFNYKPIELTFKLDEEVKTYQVFSMSFANSRQFGNNAFIAPNALLDDGLMDIAIIRPFPVFLFPLMALRLFNGSLPKTKYYTCIRTKKVEILDNREMNWHIDGESVKIRGPVSIRVDEKSLTVIAK